MRQKTKNIQRDQYALLVAVERIAQMLAGRSAALPHAKELRIECGPVEHWDDIVEHHLDGRENRWQVKRQSTNLTKDQFLLQMSTLSQTPIIEGFFVVRDMVDVEDIGSLRILRDLSDRMHQPGASSLPADCETGERTWLKWMRDELLLEDALIIDLLKRLTIRAYGDERDIKLRALYWLAPQYGEQSEVAWALIHTFVSLHPDGLIAITPDLIHSQIHHLVPRATQPVHSTDALSCNTPIDLTQFETDLHSRHWPVREGAYEQAQAHLECRHRSEALRPVQNKWTNQSPPYNDNDTIRCLRLFTFAEEWSHAWPLLGQWMANSTTMSQDVNGAFHHYFLEFLRRQPALAFHNVGLALLQEIAINPKTEAFRLLLCSVSWMAERWNMPDIPKSEWSLAEDLYVSLQRLDLYPTELRPIGRRLQETR